MSHLDDRASRIVSALVVGDSDDEPQTQREEDLRPCVDAASGADGPEAAVLECIVGPFDLSPAVVRLVQDQAVELNVLAVVFDGVFNPVLDTERVVRVSRVVRGNWHDLCGQ